jgi:CcmD family protein
VGYLIAAYGIVIGSLLAYGLWLQRQRRALARELEALARRGGEGDAESASGARR